MKSSNFVKPCMIHDSDYFLLAEDMIAEKHKTRSLFFLKMIVLNIAGICKIETC